MHEVVRGSNAAAADFATLLRGFRVGLGLSQLELAGRSSLSERGISDLERGQRRAPGVRLSSG